MIKKPEERKPGNIRKKAEDILTIRKHNLQEAASEADLLKLSHELEVHQIELEIINDELKRAKEQAEVTAEKYAELYYAPLGYFTVTRTGEITDVNPTGSQMLGRHQTDLVSTSMNDYLKGEPKTIFNLFLTRIFSSGIIQTCDLTLPGNGREPVYVYMNGLVTADDTQCQLIAIDITDRKKAEKEYQRLLVELSSAQNKLSVALESGNIGIWEWDLGTGEIILDSRAEKLFGRKSGPFGKKLSALSAFVHDDDVVKITAGIRKALKEGHPLEVIIRTSNNPESKFLSFKAHIKKDGSGKPVSFTGVCFDVTAAKETERTIMQLNEELRSSNSDLEHFAYVASHDLQEPLRMVTSFVQLLSLKYGENLDNDAKDYINFAVEGSKRMYELLNGLLTYSRLITKGKPLEEVDMNQVLRVVKDNLKLLINERNVLIRSELLPVIKADDTQMIQLLQNLIANAIKFSPGQPKIQISSRKEEHQYVISVKDEGIGIDPVYFDRIFEIFQRLLPRNESEGIGIGLAICKKIVERHKGRIWVESEPGKGSVFSFSIPFSG